jgi:hypothetical protein
MRQERTIILCVIPANQDISTIDILERAYQVRPTRVSFLFAAHSWAYHTSDGHEVWFHFV